MFSELHGLQILRREIGYSAITVNMPEYYESKITYFIFFSCIEERQARMGLILNLFLIGRRSILVSGTATPPSLSLSEY